jgi:hypothetical protein
MPVLVKALGYYSHRGGKQAKGLSKVKAHLKYLEHGKEHPNEPYGFSQDREEMSRAEFLAEIEKQPERGVIAHKLVISLSQNERDELGIDMRQLVRATMDDWSQRLGRPLKWIGFEHMDAGHPHVHVVVAGYAGEKQVGLYERDLISLRESSEREKARQAELERLMPSKIDGRSLEKELDRIAREVKSPRPMVPEREPQRSPERSRESGWDRGR